MLEAGKQALPLGRDLGRGEGAGVWAHHPLISLKLLTVLPLMDAQG